MQPKNVRRASRWSIGAILVVVAMLLPTLSAASAATPAASTPQTWAYGALVWNNETARSSAYTETVRTYVGVQAITTMTNVTSSLYEMNEVYTVAESYYVQYCRPNCASATLSENYSETYLSVTNEWANLTRSATVYEHGTAATAYGILNASSGYSENLTETYLGMKGSALYYQGHYDLGYTAGSSIAFTPALGLIPATSSTGLTWNATSAYAATGGWFESYSYNFTEPAIGYNYSYDLPQYSGSDTLAGNETIAGEDLGPVTLSGGATARSIELSYTGAYDIALGYLITPAGGELFQGNTGWSVGISPAAVAANVVDVATTSNGSNTPDVVGSSTTWTVGPSTPPGNTSATSPSQSAAPTNTGTVQTQPEPLPYAEATSRCLAGTCAAPTLPAVPAARWGLSLVALGIVLSASAALGIAIALGVRHRRRSPPTPPRVPPGALGRQSPPLYRDP